MLENPTHSNCDNTTKAAAAETASGDAVLGKGASTKDKNKKLTNATIVLASLILGSPFVYLGLILVVLNKPEIMTILNLNPFVLYLMHEALPDGYTNVIQLTDQKFAVYFFNFHAASILIFSALVSLTFVVTYFYNRHNPSNIRAMLESPNHKSAISPYMLILASTLFLIFLPVLMLNFPSLADDRSKFSIIDRGLGMFIFAWANGIIVSLASVSAIYAGCKNYYWPKLKEWQHNYKKL